MEDLAKICYNKRTGQAIVFLKKKRYELLKNQKAKFLRIKEEDIL